MPRTAARSAGDHWLDVRTAARLQRRVQEGLRRARAQGTPTLVSVTAAVAAAPDPSAVIAASRRAEEPWFCFEQPDRDGFALAALGQVRALEAAGPERFERLAASWRSLAAGALADDHTGPDASGLVAVGGLAFAGDGGHSPAWKGFAPASFVVPAITLVRRSGETWLTLNLDVAPDDTAGDALDRAERRLAGLHVRDALPLFDPAPVGAYEVASSMPPAHYEEAVARAVQRIRAGELEKIVLAREVEVHAPQVHDAPALVGLLREAFPSSFVYAVGRGEATFIGASPELLIRRDGQRASTVALAGSARRSADPAIDDHLGEQLLHSDKDRRENAIVARRIARALRPHAVWVTAAPEPVLVRVANIQHLAAPIRAQLRSPISVIELAALLHPTPAVGAEPAAALDLIPALEGLDRGWYAGPVGWSDASGDGEFCVALRCALLRGTRAHCYAGCGIVRDSEPAAELAESEVKLGAMLPLLAG
jgi:salicylate biosynthesis isochorismate synthase/menaquinone-specific isochorismate synthase